MRVRVEGVEGFERVCTVDDTWPRLVKDGEQIKLVDSGGFDEQGYPIYHPGDWGDARRGA